MRLGFGSGGEAAAPREESTCSALQSSASHSSSRSYLEQLRLFDVMNCAPASRTLKGRSACDLCRLRKIRCDRAQPACETCHLARLPCTFTAAPTQNRQGLRQELADAQSRVQELETALATAQKTLGSTRNPSTIVSSEAGASPASSVQTQASVNYIPDTHALDVALAAFRWHLSHCGLGTSLSSTRAAFYSSIHQQTGLRFDLDDFLSEAVRTFDSQGLNTTKRTTTTRWPPLPLVQHCIRHYAQAGLYSMFPFADVEALQTLVNANVFKNPQTARAAHRACLAAFTANITQMHRHEPAFAEADPDAYAQAGLTLIPELLMETPDLRTLEAIMMLAIYIAPLGQPQSAEFLLGIAVQVLYNLGGNRIQPSRENPRRFYQNRHLRALFWLCFGMDTEFSIRKRQPPLINDAHCDLILPEAYPAKPSEHHFYWKPLSPNELLYPSDLRLNLIKSKIYRLLYSPQSQELSEARRLQHIRELDDELSALRMEYPVECRPDAFATERAPDYLFHDLSIRGVSVHLEYFYCLGQIHGASDPFSISNSRMAWSPLPSSAEICYEAARSTLIFMLRVRHYINYHTFWIHAQFLLTAAITLFRFLILRPTAQTFARDIEILEVTAEIFSQFCQSHDDDERNCFPPFFLTHAFIQRLVVLAREALARASRQDILCT